MQDSQQINFWLEAAKIAVPAFVALLAPVLATLWLSKRTEKYKTELTERMQKDLEVFKSELELDLFEHQTRYSLLAEQKARSLKDLSELLAEAEIALEKIDRFTDRLEAFGGDLKNERIKDEALQTSLRALETVEKLDKFYRSRRIFFGAEICAEIDRVIIFLRAAAAGNTNHINVKIGLMEGFRELVFVGADQMPVRLKMQENKLKLAEMVKNLKSLKKTLETKFREIIESEKSRQTK